MENCINSNSFSSSERPYNNLIVTLFQLSNCFFTRTTSVSSQGGIIFFSISTLIHMEILKCTFYECKCTGSYWSGGAIYFSCSEGSSNLTYVCADLCYTTLGGHYHCQFAYIFTKNDKYCKISYLTLSKCAPNINIERKCSCVLDQGHQIVNNLNSSLNYGGHGSSFYFHGSASSSNSFSNYYGNYVSAYSNQYLTNTNSLKCNYLSNSAVTYSVISGSNSFITDSVFIGNTNTLFSGSLIVSNSFISHNINNYGSSSIHSNRGNYYFITSPLELYFYKTYFCFAENPIFLNQFSNSFKIETIFKFYLLFLFFYPII